MAVMLFAAAGSGFAGAAGEFASVETRLTSDPANQYDPALSGDVVVYTGDTGALGTDIFYCDLTTGSETHVTSQNGKQQLSDVYGRYIVYTDFAPPIVDGVRSASDVVVYAIPPDGQEATSVTLTSGSAAAAGNPAIGLTSEGHPLVAWEDRRDGNLEIYARDLAKGDERRVSFGASDDTNPSVADGRIVWEHRDGTQRDVEVYDWATEAQTQVEPTAEDEASPEIDGEVVVYQAVRDAEQDIFAANLATGVQTRLELPGVQRNPNVSGSLVSFEDLSSGVSHVLLWDMASGVVFHLTGGASAQFLNDIDGRRVVYTDDRNVQQDIYVNEFALPAEGVAPLITSAASAEFTVGVEGSFPVTTSGTPVPTLTPAGTLPDGLQFRDNGDGTATITGTPALATGGIYRVTLAATNGVAPDAQQTLTLKVGFAYSGFFQPIDNKGVFNTTNAGRGIPVKFDLGGAQGLGVLAAGYPRSIQISCEPGQTQDQIEETQTAGGASLTYEPLVNAPIGQYLYVWKTDKAWAAQCRQLQIQFVDGQIQTANFRFAR